MEEPSVRRSCGIVLLALLVVATIATVATARRSATPSVGNETYHLEEDRDVYVRWAEGVRGGCAEGDERETRSNPIDPNDGDHHWTVDVVNCQPSPVWNVTLTVESQGVDLNATLGTTFAGNPTAIDYAHWPFIRGDGVGVVLMDTDRPQERGPYTMRFVTFFDTADGNESYSVTTYTGRVVHAGLTAQAAPYVLPAATFLAGLGVGGGLTWWRYRHRAAEAPP